MIRLNPYMFGPGAMPGLSPAFNQLLVPAKKISCLSVRPACPPVVWREPVEGRILRSTSSARTNSGKLFTQLSISMQARINRNNAPQTEDPGISGVLLALGGLGVGPLMVFPNLWELGARLFKQVKWGKTKLIERAENGDENAILKLGKLAEKGDEKAKEALRTLDPSLFIGRLMQKVIRRYFEEEDALALLVNAKNINVLSCIIEEAGRTSMAPVRLEYYAETRPEMFEARHIDEIIKVAQTGRGKASVLDRLAKSRPEIFRSKHIAKLEKVKETGNDAITAIDELKQRRPDLFNDDDLTDRLSQTRKMLREECQARDDAWLWDGHIKVVADIARRLAEEHGADVEMVVLGAYFHDVGRIRGLLERHASPEGAKIAREIMEQLGYDEGTIGKIEHLIVTHEGKNGGPSTLEEKLVSAADVLSHFRLDFYSTLVRRKYPFGKSENERIQYYLEKLEKDILLVPFEDERKRINPIYKSLKAIFEKYSDDLKADRALPELASIFAGLEIMENSLDKAVLFWKNDQFSNAEATINEAVEKIFGLYPAECPVDKFAGLIDFIIHPLAELADRSSGFSADIKFVVKMEVMKTELRIYRKFCDFVRRRKEGAV